MEVLFIQRSVIYESNRRVYLVLVRPQSPFSLWGYVPGVFDKEDIKIMIGCPLIGPFISQFFYNRGQSSVLPFPIYTLRPSQHSSFPFSNLTASIANRTASWNSTSYSSAILAPRCLPYTVAANGTIYSEGVVVENALNVTATVTDLSTCTGSSVITWKEIPWPPINMIGRAIFIGCNLTQDIPDALLPNYNYTRPRSLIAWILWPTVILLRSYRKSSAPCIIRGSRWSLFQQPSTTGTIREFAGQQCRTFDESQAPGQHALPAK